MASKWLRAFLETEVPPVSLSAQRAESAKSANRPRECPAVSPIGTKGPFGTAERKKEEAQHAAELSALMALAGQEEAAQQPGARASVRVDDIDERAAIIEYGDGIPLAWAEGYAALSTMLAPSGFAPERWSRVIDAAGGFIDQWANRAAECGWSDLDVFGCDPDRPDARFDAMGLVLLLDRCEVASIDEGGADLLVTATGARQRFRRRPLPPGTVPLWKINL